MLDKFIYTTFEKKSPEYKDTDVLKTINTNIYLGGAANVAHTIKNVEAVPILLGTIGNDVNATILVDLLKEVQINSNYLIKTENSTTTKSRIFKNNLPLVRIDEEIISNSDSKINEQIIKQCKQIIEEQKPDAIILQDYNKGVLNQFTIPNILKLAEENLIPVFVDPKFENLSLYQHCYCIKPNKIEFDAIVESLKIGEMSFEEQLTFIKQHLNAQSIFVTKGNEGISCIDNDIIQNFPIHEQISNADVCGAGDSVIALICLSYLNKNSTIITAKLANIAGYIACSNKNVYAIKIADILDIINNNVH